MDNLFFYLKYLFHFFFFYHPGQLFFHPTQMKNVSRGGHRNLLEVIYLPEDF